VERVLKRCGFEVRNIFTGDGSFESLKSAHTAHLNIVMCHRSINYIAEMMRQKYGMNWMKVNFIGMNASCQSLRKIAKYFDDPELTKRVEEVIADEMAAIKEDMEYYRSKLEGKTAGVFAGGARAHHYKILLKDLGMKAIITGYEFAHRDDYEGREVIPTIKEDADSKNIENLILEPDPKLYRKPLTEKQIEALKEKGIVLGDYPGLFPDTEAEDIVLDN
jgi:nitrogenase molybdenum-iron protein alpha chain